MIAFRDRGADELCQVFRRHRDLPLGVLPYNPLQEQLEGTEYEVHSIGDAIKGRTAVDAIYEGAKLGVTI